MEKQFSEIFGKEDKVNTGAVELSVDRGTW